MSDFLFNVGDVVTHKMSPEIDRLFIVERNAQECPGGVQRHYDCRIVSKRVGLTRSDLTRFNEIELMAVPAEDPKLAAVEHLNSAKEWAVVAGEWDMAAAMRDLADRVKKWQAQINEQASAP